MYDKLLKPRQSFLITLYLHTHCKSGCVGKYYLNFLRNNSWWYLSFSFKRKTDESLLTSVSLVKHPWHLAVQITHQEGCFKQWYISPVIYILYGSNFQPGHRHLWLTFCSVYQPLKVDGFRAPYTGSQLPYRYQLLTLIRPCCSWQSVTHSVAK